MSLQSLTLATHIDTTEKDEARRGVDGHQGGGSIPHRHGVVGQDAGHAAGAVVDVQGLAVVPVGAASTGGELVVVV